MSEQARAGPTDGRKWEEGGRSDRVRTEWEREAIWMLAGNDVLLHHEWTRTHAHKLQNRNCECVHVGARSDAGRHMHAHGPRSAHS